MKKQDTAHTSRSSGARMTFEFAITGYCVLGSTAHQPIASSSLYSNMPGMIPESTICSCFFLLTSPLLSMNSPRRSFQCIHQQPAQAPAAPKSFSKSSQFFLVNGLYVSDIDLPIILNFLSELQEITIAIINCELSHAVFKVFEWVTNSCFILYKVPPFVNIISIEIKRSGKS